MSKIYGIDLGTTNSLLGSGDKLYTGLVPSVVDLQSGSAGTSQLKNVHAVRSFKCDISLAQEGQLSVSASARVLRQLVTESGEDVKQVVISVPAYFSDNQRQATIKAAEIAGLEVVHLINEPTAAAIYASRNRQSLSLVFDLGGGTFDVSVVDSRFGDYDVQATDGCILGGDNFDANIRKWAIKEGAIKIHHLKPEDLAHLLWDCTKLKIAVQKNRTPQVIDLSPYGAGQAILTPETYVEIMKLTFSSALLKARRVLQEAIPVGEPYDLILVGGSTRCPYLQEWVAQELGQNPIPMFYDPDKIVAQGASLYAEMLSAGVAQAQVSDVTRALSVGLEDGTVRTIIPRNAKIPVHEKTMLINANESRCLQVDLYQGDSVLASQNERIGQLLYDYGEVVPAGEGEVVVEITVKEDGTILFSCKQLLRPPVEVVLNRNGSRL